MSKKVLLVAGIVILLGGFFAYEKFAPNQQTTTVVVNTPTPTLNSATSTPQATTIASGYKDGTYVGAETSSMYGKAKVQVVIANGQITDVQFVEFPNDRVTTTSKSNMAMPIIKQEVIQSQSANVNTVSGATQTSASFIQSISSALNQAS
jgi:uncharacterized protein with FMN-binding domain